MTSVAAFARDVVDAVARVRAVGVVTSVMAPTPDTDAGAAVVVDDDAVILRRDRGGGAVRLSLATGATVSDR